MTTPARAFRWPYFVWGAVVVGIILVVIAVFIEARRVHQLKEERIKSGYLPNPTNPAPRAP